MYITNESGDYWAGDRWVACVQAAEWYDRISDLPAALVDQNGDELAVQHEHDPTQYVISYNCPLDGNRTGIIATTTWEE